MDNGEKTGKNEKKTRKTNKDNKDNREKEIRDYEKRQIKRYMKKTEVRRYIETQHSTVKAESVKVNPVVNERKTM